MIERLTTRFGQLPPTFAFIDPFGAEEIPTAISTPLLQLPRCEVLIYFPVSFLARFAEQSEFKPILDSLYAGEQWKEALAASDFETRKRILHDLFLTEAGRFRCFARPLRQLGLEGKRQLLNRHKSNPTTVGSARVRSLLQSGFSLLTRESE